MDSLKYFYKLNTNQLTRITDAVANTAFADDIDNQQPSNYKYDKIGNLTKDVQNGVDSIYWNVYGKITQVNKPDGSSIVYRYDAMQNRIATVLDKYLQQPNSPSA